MGKMLMKNIKEGTEKGANQVPNVTASSQSSFKYTTTTTTTCLPELP